MRTVSDNLTEKAKNIRRLILTSTTTAGSGHPTSCLSAVEFMTVLVFGGFFDQSADHLLFSKGHAAPLLYALYATLGKIEPKELLSLRRLNSPFEGHPSMKLPFVEAATGSLGQGLSIGVGLALGEKLDHRKSEVFVLLGDGEMAEGANWEAIALAKHYKLQNLTALIDVNCLEQAGETMDGWQTEIFQEKFRAFGWQPILINDGHNLEEITNAFNFRLKLKTGPVAIIAKTIKGKGVSLFENKLGWHGKTLNKQELDQALLALETKPNPNQSQKQEEVDEVLKRLIKLTT